MARTITNTEDIIDSRDIVERIDELTKDYLYGGQDLRTPNEMGELAALLKLAEQGEDNIEDWQYGAMLIREDYFVTYAEESTKDIEHETFEKFPSYMVIDWEATAENLLTDYTEYTFDGVTYYAR